jgi:hypothetical protein
MARMQMPTTTRTALALVGCAAALCACGGSKNPAASASVLTLSAQGSAPAPTIGGVELTLVLPQGVIAAADGAGSPGEGVLAASGEAAGGAAVVAGHYTAATSSSPGTLKLVLIKTTGFAPGELDDLGSGEVRGAFPREGALVL